MKNEKMYFGTISRISGRSKKRKKRISFMVKVSRWDKNVVYDGRKEEEKGLRCPSGVELNSLDLGVFTHTDGAPGLVSTSSSLVPLPSFFLSQPVGPCWPEFLLWPPPRSYFFFSAAVSDTLLRLLAFHPPLILPFLFRLSFLSLSVTASTTGVCRAY